MVSKCHWKCLQLEKNKQFSEKSDHFDNFKFGSSPSNDFKIFLNDLLTCLGVIKLNPIMILKTISDISQSIISYGIRTS